MKNKTKKIDINRFEYPVCTICQTDTVVDFPAGAYHLNLSPPIRVVRCKECGLLFLSPRPGKEMRISLTQGHIPAELQVYSSHTADYGQVNQSRDRIFRQRIDTLIRLTRSSTIESMLDVGASQGTFIKVAEGMGLEAFGVEPSDSCFYSDLESAPISRGFAEKLPFKNNTFDIVHANHVFEHLANPLEAACECYRVLKPGGLFFLEVPNQLDNVMFLRDKLFGRIHQRKRGIRSVHHLYFFSRKTMKLLLSKTGFSDIRIKDYYSWKSRGWRLPFSLLTRTVGLFWGGGDRLSAWGYKN